MKSNKHIERDDNATKIFNDRSLANDYRTLKPLLQKGMRVLDVGCGTGAISKDVAKLVGETGKVIGIDNTEKFILSGKETYADVPNLELVHSDLFAFESTEPFDLIISARTLQWLSDPKAALLKMKEMLKPNGQISILDYNHEALAWNPNPPASMRSFYDTFLKWRADAGMSNRMADELADLLKETGFAEIEVINSDECYDQSRANFHSKVGIWSKVAGSTQMVKEGYLDNDLRLQAIEEYDKWVAQDAVSMTMKLNEVRGIKIG
ncbi:MAG: methyltransferase domain-containing protein [Saprospiraceae bacterium]